MCMLLKLHYAKLDVSSLFCSKVIGNCPPPPLNIGRVKVVVRACYRDTLLRMFLNIWPQILFSGRIQLDCFYRSVHLHSQCTLCNKTWLKFRKAVCLF